jgi:RNA polymerase sigma-70 factor (ECF subfamily)
MIKRIIANYIWLFRNYQSEFVFTIVLYYVEGYSVEEIKEILEIPAGTVKSRLANGRKLLKIKLENMEANYG